MKRLTYLMAVVFAAALLVTACSGDGGGDDKTNDTGGFEDAAGEVMDDLAEQEIEDDAVEADESGEDLEPDVGDPCLATPCTELPQADECAEDGVTAIHYLPVECVVEDGLAVCNYPSEEEDCSESDMICDLGVCIEPCGEMVCNSPPEDVCDEDGTTLVSYVAEGVCVWDGTEALCEYDEETTDCSEDDLICADGGCVDPCADVDCDEPPVNYCEDDGMTLVTYVEAGVCAWDGTETECVFEEGSYDCADDDMICLGGACVVEGTDIMPALAGDVIFSEFMAKSMGGSDKGEWFEIHNPTDGPFDLMGCIIKDAGSDEHQIAEHIIVSTMGYVLFARSADEIENHGLPTADYIYSGVALSNSDDELVIDCGDVLIDEVIFTSVVVSEGVAAQLDPDTLDSVANDDLNNWCLASEEYGTAAKMGTPGLANSACPEVPDPCLPDNPCIESPEDVCAEDGITLLTYETPGVCTNNLGVAECAYTETETDCSLDNDKVCDNAECTDPPPPLNPPEAGEVIFTEFMAKSMGGSDTGEWVEIYNTTNEIIDLDDCHLKDLGSDDYLIVGPLSIEANGYLLLAKTDVVEDNHGLPVPDLVYAGGLSLSNSEDELILECGDAVLIDKVEFTGDWVTEGEAVQLKVDQMDATANDDLANWCGTTDEYGTAQKLGTPGAANTDCPVIPDPCLPDNPCTDAPVDKCDVDGKTLLTYETPGICTNDNGVADCAYTETATDCSLDNGKICQDAACVEPPADPCEVNPCDQPPMADSCDVDGVTVLTYVLPGACTNDNGVASCDYTATTIDCSLDNGKVCDVGACVEPPPILNPPEADEVIFTEFMAKSMGGADSGEWVELYNTTNEIIDLDNCYLKDLGSDKHMIVGPLSIAANGYLLLAKTDVVENNHGLPVPGYVYAGFTLANSEDELVLECGDEVVIDSVLYTGDWVVEGIARQLKKDQMDATANDDLANWCDATDEYGTAQKLGTPGAANTDCPVIPDPCVPDNPCLLAPVPECDVDGKTLFVFLAPGGCTNNNGVADCAYGVSFVDCSLDNGKICKDGACVAPPADPCEVNPCDQPPLADSCDVDGVTVLTYVLPGACTNDNGMASCEYTETTVDCSQDNGKVCDAGACVEPPPVLNPPAVGEVIFTEFMAKSMGGTDVGEWVEIYNTTNEIIDLDNCHLKDLGSDNHTIVGSLSIAANGYLLLAKSDVPADNHGLPAPGYVYTSYTLSNSSDELVLECGEEVVIDKVEYDGGWVAEGVSYQLKTDQMDATANDDIANWCASTQEYGTAQKLGTPGAENTVCQ